jgi:hypothetical protein
VDWYVAFEFDGHGGAVLDCPMEGNAIYVVSGDWKAVVTQTRAEVKTLFAGRSTKIVHRTAWMSRLREAVRNLPPMSNTSTNTH